MPAGLAESTTDYEKQEITVHLKQICLKNLRQRSRGRTTDSFVTVSVDQEEQCASEVVKDTLSPAWSFDAPRVLSVTPSSSLTFTVYRVRRKTPGFRNKYIGQFTASLATLLNEGTYPHHLDTTLCRVTHETGRISVDLAIDGSGGPTWRDSLIDEAGAKIAQVDEDHGGSSAAPAAQSGGSTILGQAVDNLGRVVTFVDNVSEVHPYCKTAWIILSAVYKAVKHQREMDDAMRFLIIELKDAIAIVRECRDLRVLQGATDVVKELAKLVIVGASLIDEYMKHRTLGRTYIAASTPLDGRIKDCKDELHRLHQKLVLHLLIDVRQNVRANNSQGQSTTAVPDQVPVGTQSADNCVSSQTSGSSTNPPSGAIPSTSSAHASPSIPRPTLYPDILHLTVSPERLQSSVSLPDPPAYETQSLDSMFVPWVPPVHPSMWMQTSDFPGAQVAHSQHEMQPPSTSDALEHLGQIFPAFERAFLLSVLHSVQNNLQKAADKLAEMCKSQSLVDSAAQPPHVGLVTPVSIPNTPALTRTLSTASSSSSSSSGSEEDSTLPTPLFDEPDMDIINFLPPGQSTTPRPISRTGSGDPQRVVNAAFDGYVGGFHTPSAIVKAQSRVEGWTPHLPIGQPMA